METRRTKQGIEYTILTTDEVFDILDRLQDAVDETKVIAARDYQSPQWTNVLSAYANRLDRLRKIIIADDGDVYYMRTDNLSSVDSWVDMRSRCTFSGPIPDIIKQVEMPEGFLDRYNSIQYDPEKNRISSIPLTDKDKDYINASFKFFTEFTGSSSNEGDEIRIYDSCKGSTRRCSYDQSLIRILYDELSALSFGYHLDTEDIAELESMFNSTNEVSYYQRGILDKEYFDMINTKLISLYKKGILRKCRNCNKMYIMTLGEYEWYKDKKLNIPKRCKACRYARKASKK